jgi:uncharacterized repeat protein (TIGR02543 family)
MSFAANSTLKEKIMTKKNILIKLSMFAVISSVLFFSGCFSLWQGDLAKIVISFAGSDRAAYDSTDSETHQKLEHNIILTSNTENLQYTLKGSTTFEAYVTPGKWKVLVNSLLEEEIYATSGIIEVDLKAGQDNIQKILMYQALIVTFESRGGTLVPAQIVPKGFCAEKPADPTLDGSFFGGWYTDNKEFNNLFNFSNAIEDNLTLYAKWSKEMVVPGNNITDKLNYIKNNAVNDGHYIVEVGVGENIVPNYELNYDNNNITITLTGGDVSLRNNGNGSMFKIGSGVKLILRGITLNGRTSNINSLVVVNRGGSLEMNEGAKITGNKANNGGGVAVNEGATFTMNGGEISGNTAVGIGGGVYVGSNGTFIMTDEANDRESYRTKITGNTTSANGGGVYVDNNGTFTMNGGEISGNTAQLNLGDNKGNGGGVVNYGTFIMMNGGKISGNTAQGSGGGVLVSSGTFKMEGGDISDNTAVDWGGGGVLVSGGTFKMSEGKIYENKTQEDYQSGGGVLVSDVGTFEMSGGKIYKNTTAEGGGVAVVANKDSINPMFIMSGGAILENIATRNGGGVYVAVKYDYDKNKWPENSSSTFTMTTGGDISGNTAEENGGGVYIYNGDFTMKDGNIYSNKTKKWGGGGVYIDNGDFTMTGGNIYGNTTAVKYIGDSVNQSGGGVLVSNGTFKMEGGEIYENTTGKGGGVAVVERGDNKTQSFTMTGGKIYNNTANNTGGGVYVAVEFNYDENIDRWPNGSSSTFTMNDGEIYGNTVKGDETHFHGGGVFVWNATFIKVAGTIKGYTPNDPDNSNKVVDSNDSVKTQQGQGHAVYVKSDPAAIYRDDNVLEGDPLDYKQGDYTWSY